MSVTTGLAVYGALLSTIGVGWNLYREVASRRQEKRKANDEAVAKRLEQKRKLFVFLRGIPCLEGGLELYQYYTTSMMAINEHLGRATYLLVDLFDLPEAKWLYEFRVPVVHGHPTTPENEAEFKKAYEDGYLPLAQLYRKLKEELATP